MNKEYQDKFIQLTNEINDALEAIHTGLKREKILIDKLIPILPSSHLEEWGEFLIDWGNTIQKWANLNKTRDNLLLEILGIKNDTHRD